MIRCFACAGDNPRGMRFCGHCAVPLEGAPGGQDALNLDASVRQELAEPLRRLVSRQVAERVAAGGELSDEWRLVTTLFADISGYVTLSERLDPEALVDATNPIVAVMTDVAERYEAHVAKFAGDALLCMFGAPVVHEDDADRALRAALDMMTDLDRLRPKLVPEARDLTLHIGVNTGRVVASLFGGEAGRIDYNVMGDAVNMAQRLESAAPGGEIYVGDATVRLTRDRFLFDRIGEVMLRGKALPVVAWRLLGTRDASASKPRPGSGGAARTADAPVLIGRRVELAALGGVYARLLHGDGALVAVTGDPGAGKTRLIDHASQMVRPRGVSELSARFAAVGEAPYAPFASLIRQACDIDADASPAAAAERMAEALFSLGVADAEPHLARVAGINTDPPRERPEAFRRGVADALSLLISALARTAPLAITVEDVHWADDASVAVLASLAAICSREPLALIFTARTVEDLAPITDAAPLQLRYPIALGELDDASLGVLVAGVCGRPVDPAITQAVAARAGGNPYFVEETVRWLIQEQALHEDAGLWRLRHGWDAGGVPPTIEGVIAARIDRLPVEAAAVLQVAAVVGRRAPLALLSKVLVDEKMVSRSARVLVEAGLANQTDEDAEPMLLLHHALVAHVAYERLLRRRRAELHAAVASAVEDLWGDGSDDDDVAEMLAHHRFSAGAYTEAFPLLLRAGERARAMFANEAAQRHFERAAVAAPPEQTTQMLLAVADLAQLRGDYDHALENFRRVRDAAEDSAGDEHAATRLRAICGIVATLRKRGAYEESLAELDQALHRGIDDPSLRLEQGWTLSVAGRYAEAIACLHAGLNAALSARDGVAAQTLLELARAETVERDLDSALAHATAAREIFTERDDSLGITAAVRVAGAALHRLGRLDASAQTLREGLEMAARTGNVEETGACLINLGMVEFERGNVADAIECDQRAIAQFESIAHGSGRAIGYGNLAEKLLHAGDLDAAAQWCRKALEHASMIGHAPTISDATRTLAGIASASGRGAEAAETYRSAAGLYTQMGLSSDAAECERLAAEATSPT